MLFFIGLILGLIPGIVFPAVSLVPAVHIMHGVFLCIVAFACVYICITQKYRVISYTNLFPILFLGTAYYVSSVFSIDTTWGTEIIMHSGSLMLIVFSIWIICHVDLQKKNIDIIATGFIYSALSLYLYTCIGYAFSYQWFTNLFGSLTSFSVYSGIVICTAVYLLQYSRQVILPIVAILFSIPIILVTDWYIIFGISFSLFVAIIISIFGANNWLDMRKKIGIYIFFVVLSFFSPYISNSAFSHIQRLVPDRHNAQVELGTSVVIVEKIFDSSFVRMLFGTGPNTFLYAWHMYKPVDILDSVNNTKYWDYDFAVSGSTVLTDMANVGIFGFLFWLYIALLIAMYGRKVSNTKKPEEIYLVMILILLYTLCIFSTIEVGLYILFFVLLSVMFSKYGNIYPVFGTKNIQVTYLLIPIICCVIFFVSNEYLAYKSTNTAYSVILNMYQLNKKQTDDFVKAEKKIRKAIQYKDTFEYRRLLSILQLAQMDTGTTTQQVLAQVEADLRPVMAKSVYFRDWLQIGKLYEYYTMSGSTTSASLVYQSYRYAALLAPTHPEPQFRIALVHLYAGNYVQAKESLKRALVLKPDYQDAILLYRQLNATNVNILGNMGI